MSKWQDIEKENIEIDREEMEINILLGKDYYGNSYATIKLSHLIPMLKESGII